MRLASWLFLKNSQSIWVERLAERSLITAGPGPSRQQRDFISEAALEAFEMALAERLAADGWFLWGVDRDRRRAARPTNNGTPLPPLHTVPESGSCVDSPTRPLHGAPNALAPDKRGAISNDSSHR